MTGSRWPGCASVVCHLVTLLDSVQSDARSVMAGIIPCAAYRERDIQCRNGVKMGLRLGPEGRPPPHVPKGGDGVSLSSHSGGEQVLLPTASVQVLGSDGKPVVAKLIHG